MANEIVIKGAREHNLKDVDLTIPRDELVVITGLSGSGKSSLAFDTMYAEGQRRYVESLSSYARMFLGQMSKPDVDSIDGLSPAVSIDQKTTSKNPRSTVGTTTEIYDYLRLLFARVGVPHCPECGREIKKQTTDQVTDDILRLGDDAQGESTKAILMAPVVAGRKGEFTKLFADLQKEGFSRVRIDGEIVKLSGEPVTLEQEDQALHRRGGRPRHAEGDRAQSRIAEAVELACKLAQGRVLVQVLGPRRETARRGRWHLLGRHGRPRGGRAFVLAGPRVPRARPLHGRAAAPRLLLQCPLRRLPRLPRHRQPRRGGPLARGTRPVPHAERGRHRAVQERQLLPPGAARRGPACGHRRRHTVGGHAEEGPEGAACTASATRRCASTTAPWTAATPTGTSSGRACSPR